MSRTLAQTESSLFLVLVVSIYSFLGNSTIPLLAETEMESMESQMNTKTQKVMFSRASGNWITPPDFYKKLDEEFHFDFDPCPYPLPAWDGLQVDWGHGIYVNPPYGLEIVKGTWKD